MNYTGKVKTNIEIAENIWKMDISTGKVFRSLPGQFINVLVNDSYEPFLRRPFSIFDAAKNSVTIVYKVLGQGTKALTEKAPGDKLDFIGPLGKSYVESYIPNHKSQIIIIGGGTGAASTYYLAKYLRSKKIKFTFIQGARCKPQMVAIPVFRKLGCIFATDDGSLGRKGFVSGLLEEVLASQIPNHKSQTKKSEIRNPKYEIVVFACGPKPMFRAIKAVTDKNDKVKVFASFEEYMGCGIGACLSCVVEMKNGEYKRVCKDGTIFDLDEVVL
jgi:dihydroorotate dehydrogenase electron transfer subunit